MPASRAGGYALERGPEPIWVQIAFDWKPWVKPESNARDRTEHHETGRDVTNRWSVLYGPSLPTAQRHQTSHGGWDRLFRAVFGLILNIPS